MKHRPSRRWLFALAAVTAISLIATVAYAAIPDAAGIIHGCRNDKSGILRVIDSEAGQHCLAAETPLSWNQQGVPGATGPPGSSGPRAYAQVGYFGTLIGVRSSNVTDVQIVEGGAYCIAVPFTPVNVQVTLAFNSPADSIGADIGGYSGCPEGYAIAVMPLNANHVPTNSEFWIAIN